MQFTNYFANIRQRPDRAIIREEWIAEVIANPACETIQPDGQIYRWACIPEMGYQYLRVILLPDGITTHNAFFGRNYEP